MNESFFTPAGTALFAPRSPLTYAPRPELDRLKPPTFDFLWGDRDTFGVPALGQEMARLMPNGHCDVIRDTGHMVWIDQPDVCAERIESFLTS